MGAQTRPFGPATVTVELPDRARVVARGGAPGSGGGLTAVPDLADAVRRGPQYLTQAVDWALSETLVPPAAASAAVTTAATRLCQLEDVERLLPQCAAVPV